MPYILVIKLIAAHFLSDFFFQPKRWVADRNRHHYASLKLYMHGAITFLTIILLCGPSLWLVALIIGLGHIATDGAKSYLDQNTRWFLADQLVHLLIILISWIIFTGIIIDFQAIQKLLNDRQAWLVFTGLVMVTFPSGKLIELITAKWRDELVQQGNNEISLAKAGMWIGILERTIVFVLVLDGKYEAIGLLLTAKTLLRFNEKDRPESKTEYLLIGTLISIVFAAAAGIVVLRFM
jgi:hypothetical protein